jgi:hypothetical protein
MFADLANVLQKDELSRRALFLHLMNQPISSSKPASIVNK